LNNIYCFGKNVEYFSKYKSPLYVCITERVTHCGMMELADMPSCLGGEDHGINQ
jgi:hypothetical protein